MKLSKVYKVKNYEEALEKCPKGYRMLEIWELVKLASEKNKVIFETEKGNWIWFLSKTKKGDYFRRLSRDRGGPWDAGWGGDLDDFFGGCRVVYQKIPTEEEK